MSIFDKSIRVAFGILLITLLEPMAWGESYPTERFLMAATDTLSPENGMSSTQDSGALTNADGNRAVTKLSADGSGQEVTGDGRTGFWVVGILINLSVLGWFLVWAVKEWRRKRDD